MRSEPMNRDPNSSLRSSQRRAHTLAAPMLQFDLTREADQLLQMDSYAKGSPTGKTLVKEPDLRIVLMALKAGGRLEQHQTSGPISLQVLDGSVSLRVGETSVELPSGHLLALETGMVHDVEADEDAVFLLTIGRTAYQDVSDQHESHLT